MHYRSIRRSRNRSGCPDSDLLSAFCPEYNSSCSEAVAVTHSVRRSSRQRPPRHTHRVDGDADQLARTAELPDVLDPFEVGVGDQTRLQEGSPVS